MNILVTGSNGFIGKNLVVALKRTSGYVVWEYDIDTSPHVLEDGLSVADVIFHLAGINRPEREEDYFSGNTCFTKIVCESLKHQKRKPILVFTSSTQAVIDNPYGISKKLAEDIVFSLALETDIPVAVFRLPGIFGKWSRPNYNSVVATFCYNVAKDLPITISDPDLELELLYIDDLVSAFIGITEDRYPLKEGSFFSVQPTFRVTLGNLERMILGFRESRKTLLIPDFSDGLTKRLFATYVSYLPADSFSYGLDKKVDGRGELAEVLKSHQAGQIFLSRTRPGYKRGDHYHDMKVEKFVVIDGEAIIRIRHILENREIEHASSGREFRVIDIPPGYTHSIENVGQKDLIVLFWADEIYDPSSPDTYPLDAKRENQQ